MKNPHDLLQHNVRMILIVLGSGVLVYLTVLVVLNVRLSIQRGNQRKNLADMRALATALEIYRQEHGVLPKGSTAQDLKAILEPKYLKITPVYDSWGNVYIYRSDSQTSYTLISLGKDRMPDLDPSYKGPIRHFTNDISLSNGMFVVYPEGT